MLPTFPERILEQALRVLRGLHVDVRVGADADGVTLADGRVDATLLE